MVVVDLLSGQTLAVVVNPAEDEDFKQLTKARFSFTWQKFRGVTEIFKLTLVADGALLGVVGVVLVPEEDRIEIKLLSSSVENIGSSKRYKGIAGCLIAYVCRLAIKHYGANACVCLVPRTALVEHYMKSYGMLRAGRQLYIDGERMIKLMEEFL